MKYLLIVLILSFGISNAQSIKTKKGKHTQQKTLQVSPKNSKRSIYDYSFNTISGERFKFSSLKGKKIIIVNTASKCGYTPQYDALEKLYRRYENEGLIIIGFPSGNFRSQEFSTNDEIIKFCKLNYGVSFPLMEKSNVKGPKQNKIFQFLTKKSLNGKQDTTVKWNFTKFLINKSGYLEAVYDSDIKPDSKEIIDWIEK